MENKKKKAADEKGVKADKFFIVVQFLSQTNLKNIFVVPDLVLTDEIGYF